jgi:hypothetical protein
VTTPITVVIPTRERCDVLGKALQTVTAQDYDALEIIVSDNYSSDGTRDVVAAAGDPRIRYLNTGRRLSMSHNWDFALSHVQRGWVTVLGDDDGLLPGAVTKLAELAATAGVEAIRSETCYYAWPSLPGPNRGRLRVPLRSGREVRGARRWLDDALQGRATYLEGPMLYTGGFVAVAVLEKLRAASGAFYRSCIPDVYSAVAIASAIDRYLYVHEPLAINGASKHSTGTSQMSAQRAAVGSPAQRFTTEGNIALHRDLPLAADGAYPPSLQALVYESFLQTLDLRDGTPGVDHAEQLCVILGSAGRHSAPVLEWGRLFARQHALDFEAIAARAAAWRARRRPRRLAARVSAALNLYKSGAHDAVPSDVFEASLAAARIRATQPSGWRNLVRGFGRRSERPG